MIEAPELADDPRFTDNKARITNLPALVELLAPYFITRPTGAWLERLEAAGVPAGPVLSVGEMQADPHALARGMVTEVEHTTAGPVKTLGLPISFSETPGKVAQGAPLYGEHSRDVLAEFGYSDGEIEQLIAAGTVAAL